MSISIASQAVSKPAFKPSHCVSLSYECLAISELAPQVQRRLQGQVEQHTEYLRGLMEEDGIDLTAGSGRPAASSAVDGHVDGKHLRHVDHMAFHQGQIAPEPSVDGHVNHVAFQQQQEQQLIDLEPSLDMFGRRLNDIVNDVNQRYQCTAALATAGAGK
jgi:hypothetical protein